MQNGRRYRLVLADDHQDILHEVRELVASDFDIVGAVQDGAALIDVVAALKPDAVICDIYMPGLNGIESGAQIVRTGLCSAVVILTMYNEPHLIRRVLREGIHGYVLKEDATEELISAVYAVLGGRQYLSQGVAAKTSS